MWCNQKDSAAEVHDNGLGETLHQTQSETLKKCNIISSCGMFKWLWDLDCNKYAYKYILSASNYRQFKRK
jgi:hypothetical protein